jgi:hypothetical protein
MERASAGWNRLLFCRENRPRAAATKALALPTCDAAGGGKSLPRLAFPRGVAAKSFVACQWPGGCKGRRALPKLRSSFKLRRRLVELGNGLRAQKPSEGGERARAAIGLREPQASNERALRKFSKNGKRNVCTLYASARPNTRGRSRNVEKLGKDWVRAEAWRRRGKAAGRGGERRLTLICDRRRRRRRRRRAPLRVLASVELHQP